MNKFTRLLTNYVQHTKSTPTVVRSAIPAALWPKYFPLSSSILISHFSVFQVSPKGETFIAENDDQPHQQKSQFAASSHIQEQIPAEEYYHGHLLYDHLEYVNDTVDKIEDSVTTLECLNTKKRSVLSTTFGLMSDGHRNEMKQLLNESTATKVALKKQLRDMREAIKLYKDSRNCKSSFAVDAPDGISDDCKQSEMDEVRNILINTPTTKTIEQRAAAMQSLIVQGRSNGVDAPDGTSDDMNQEELAAIQYILNHSKKST